MKKTHQPPADGQAHLNAIRWLKIDEAAEYTGYSTWSLRRFVRSGKLQYTRVSDRGAYRFRTEWLDALLTGDASIISPKVQSRSAIADAVEHLDKHKKRSNSGKSVGKTAGKGHPALGRLNELRFR